MENLDVIVGTAECKTIKIGEKEYKLAPLGPFVAGQIIGYIKDKVRSNIAQSAKDIGGIPLKELLQNTNEAVGEITLETIDKFTDDIDVMTHLIYFSMRVYQASLLYSDLGKLLTIDNIGKIAEALMSDFPQDEKPEATPATA